MNIRSTVSYINQQAYNDLTDAVVYQTDVGIYGEFSNGLLCVFYKRLYASSWRSTPIAESLPIESYN